MRNRKQLLISSFIYTIIPFLIYFLIKYFSQTVLSLNSISFTSLIYGGLLFSPELCLIFILILSIFILFFYIIKLNKIIEILFTLQICSAGYFLMELICQYYQGTYNHLPFYLVTNGAIGWFSDWLSNFNMYLFHRSHQYMAIIFMLIVFYRTSYLRKESTLHIGDINYISTFLGKEKPYPWKIIALRLIFMFFGGSILFLIGRHKLPDTINNLYMVLPLFLGALNNSFIEELIFRGIFLSRFNNFTESGRANYLQAILFGLFHSQFISLFNSIYENNFSGFIIALLIQLAILVIYSFIGWLLGKSALETRGIGISTFIHTSIVMAIYLSKGLSY